MCSSCVLSWGSAIYYSVYDNAAAVAAVAAVAADDDGYSDDEDEKADIKL